MDLTTTVERLLPTPTVWVQGEVDLDKYLARREREKAKGHNGNGFGIPLDMAVRIYLAPTGAPTSPPSAAGNTSVDETPPAP